MGKTQLDTIARLSHHAIVERIRTRLRNRTRVELHIAGFRPAAVAVMLLDAGDTTSVTFTLRSTNLRAHSGQVSLPGGQCDPSDASAAATAVRECYEEIGVQPRILDILGAMDDEPTSTGFVITPVVTELKIKPEYIPNPHEVAQVFEAPLAIFADRSGAKPMGERRLAGKTYPRRLYRYRNHSIQGATARILEQLTDLIG
ncbi:MAG: CoA pyrophosphatase [Proteobacteria bacterium]|nr:CoA pyrophosphatase [Pseudomonadota bacterium]